ncbi:MAG: rhodanese-like domain-containing protein [Rhodospirillaceae bacterium]
MPGWILRLTLNQRLAMAAVVLGAVALFAAPYPGNSVTLNPKELALVVGTRADEVGAQELAAWIIAGRADYRLIDLRTEAEFAQYHIPTAANVPMTNLPDAGLGRQEKLVLYSGEGIHAAQAWMLLRAQGYRSVYVLKGGLDGWKNEVLFPVVADNPTAEERARDERLASVSAFFGGQARSAAAAAGGASAPALAMPDMPKVAAPPSPAGGAKASARKKKEGC